jgi:hypothetical protein
MSKIDQKKNMKESHSFRVVSFQPQLSIIIYRPKLNNLNLVIKFDFIVNIICNEKTIEINEQGYCNIWAS